MALLSKGLRADRAAIVYIDYEGGLSVAAVHGLAMFTLADSPISESVLQEVVETNRTIIFNDIKGDFQARGNVSLQLSGAVSVICIPFFYSDSPTPAGALYADTTRRPGAFHRSELLFARDCASWLECCLAGRDNVPRPEMDEPSGAALPSALSVRPTPLAPRPTAPAGDKPARAAKATSSIGVGTRDLMVLFRSLAALTQAGVMIHEGLAALARSSADKRSQSVLQGLSKAVGNGEPLSVAMERYPNAFATYLSSAVRVGERTGRLVHVLDVVSRDLEKGQRLTYRLRSALAYPLMLSAACGLLMLFGPPYLLAGQLKILSESGVPMPFLTQALMALSNLTGRPSFLILFTLAAIMLGRWAVSPGGRQRLWVWAGRLPVLSRIVRTTSLAHVSRSISLQLRAGMTVLEGLSHARQACSDPELTVALREAEDALRNGRSLTEAFRDSGYFSVTYVSFIEAGEQSGTLIKLTDWLADFYERELEDELDRFVSLAEPLLMFAMGVVTTLLLVATLKPTIAILQTL